MNKWIISINYFLIIDLEQVKAKMSNFRGEGQ